MSKLEYAPLRYSQILNLDLIQGLLDKNLQEAPFPNKLANIAIQNEIQELEPNKLIQMVFSPNFFTPDYNGPFQIVHKWLYMNSSVIRATNEKEIKRKSKDLFSMAAVVELFRQHKQVYEFDSEFVSALSKTDNIKLYPSLLRRLPYNTFYFDFSNIKNFHPFEGMFVHVKVESDDSVLLLGYRVFNGGYNSYYEILRNREQKFDGNKGYYNYNRSFLKYKIESNMHEYTRGHVKINAPDFALLNKSLPDTWMFLIQALMYLASKEPDVEESPRTQKTYRKSDRIRDNFSEIQQWDVGVRYGTKIRKIRKEAALKEETSDDDLPISVKTRKSPRPHSRCAHWQHYWTGPGRTVLELKWIEPTFVGAVTDIPIVKHKVQGGQL